MFAPILSLFSGAVLKYILFGAMALIAASSLIGFIKAPLEREIVSLRQAAKDLEKISADDAVRAEIAERELASHKEATNVYVQGNKNSACRFSAAELTGLRNLADGRRKR